MEQVSKSEFADKHIFTVYFCTHQGLVLCLSCVPERVGINEN
jgi:hypothetical protein